MKKLIIGITAFLSFSFISAQENKEVEDLRLSGGIPSSFLDVSVGLGPNHGIIGVNGVFGSKGTGLLVGVGNFDGFSTYAVGFQLAIQKFFVSVAFGAYGTYQVETPTGTILDRGLLEGTIVQMGGRIGFGKKQRTFFIMSVGYAGGDSVDTAIGPEEEGGFTAGLGLGYRIGRSE